MAEPLGHCVIHGDYWTEDCLRCHPPRPSMAEPERTEAATRVAPPEGTVEAAACSNWAHTSSADVAWAEVAEHVRDGYRARAELDLTAAMDPALGPDRLVVAGERAEERERGLRGLIRELRQFIPHERPEQGPLPAWIVDITARADAALAGGEVGPPSEREVRADQTRRIVEWLRGRADGLPFDARSLTVLDTLRGAADAIEREFGWRNVRDVLAAAAPHLIDDAMVERAARTIWDECWSSPDTDGTLDWWEEMVAKGDEPAIVQSVRADAARILRAALGEVDGDGR